MKPEAKTRDSVKVRQGRNVEGTVVQQGHFTALSGLELAWCRNSKTLQMEFRACVVCDEKRVLQVSFCLI